MGKLKFGESSSLQEKTIVQMVQNPYNDSHIVAKLTELENLISSIKPYDDASLQESVSKLGCKIEELEGKQPVPAEVKQVTIVEKMEYDDAALKEEIEAIKEQLNKKEVFDLISNRFLSIEKDVDYIRHLAMAPEVKVISNSKQLWVMGIVMVLCVILGIIF